MARIEAHEIVAHGLVCDNCESITHVRNSTSKAPGYFISPGGLTRVTHAKNVFTNINEYYFCDKTCLLNAMQFMLSNITCDKQGKVNDD
jgi:hypothetical protein